MRKRAFTLVEIMIVVLIIGILMAIAIPNFVRARENGQQKTCMANLRTIEQAKEIYTYTNSLHDGDAVDANAAWTGYAKGPFPSCPASGTYTVGNVGTNATCSLGPLFGHVYNP